MEPKILLVDDVKMFLELESCYLQPLAATVHTARNGEEALALCQRTRPDLVFMDLHMPVMNGADCCRALKEDPLLKGTPVVLITSEGKAADRLLCLQAGCDDFLTKPLDRDEFLRSAARLVPKLELHDARIRCRINAKCRAFGITFSGSVVELSRDTVVLATQYELEEGMVLDLLFVLPGPFGAVVQVAGEVRRDDSKNGPGESGGRAPVVVRLISVGPETALKLQGFIESERRRRGLGTPVSSARLLAARWEGCQEGLGHPAPLS